MQGLKCSLTNRILCSSHCSGGIYFPNPPRGSKKLAINSDASFCGSIEHFQGARRMPAQLLKQGRALEIVHSEDDMAGVQ